MKRKTIWLSILLLFGTFLVLRPNEQEEKPEIIEIVDYGDSNEIIVEQRNLVSYFDTFYPKKIYEYQKENPIEEVNESTEPIPEEEYRQVVTYAYADTIWYYLKGLEYNDYVTAGILGNIMAEVGGNSFRLDPWLIEAKNGNYYGICQWSKSYTEVWYKDLDFQLDFLRDTIEYEFEVFGRLYEEDFTYSDFLELQNEQEAALAFAKVYERCATWTYTSRENNATVALNYFGYGY